MYKFDTISTNELSLRETSLRDASHALLAITYIYVRIMYEKVVNILIKFWRVVPVSGKLHGVPILLGSHKNLPIFFFFFNLNKFFIRRNMLTKTLLRSHRSNSYLRQRVFAYIGKSTDIMRRKLTIN